MTKISRYILVTIGILVASVSIPNLYWTIFEEVKNIPIIYYSCTLNDFMIVRSGKGKTVFEDTKGNKYSTSEYEKNLPMMFFRQLMSDGRMPDTIKGIQMEPSILNKAKSFFSYTPDKLRSPQPQLNPLFESESGKVQLSMPDDFFRINNSIEFIKASNNKIDIDKSILFNIALIEKGFVFPAKIVAGIPTTRKSCDDGYFIKDSTGNLYHLKMVKGKPYVTKINIPNGIDIQYIECVDLRSKEFYCYLFTKNDGIYVLTEDVYELQRIPIEGFDPFQHTVKFNCDIFNKTIALYTDNSVQTVVVDDVYNVVDTYNETWKGKYERTDGKTFSRLFPFELSMTIPESDYINFYFKLSPGYFWVIINLGFMILASWLAIRRKSSLKKNLLDLVIVLVTGIYGFIATQIFPNKFYN